MRRLRHYFHEDRGASAAEFALVMIPFIGLVLAIIDGSMMFYANQSLQYATEAAARYYSVQTANSPASPPSPGTVQTYAKNAYTGPGISTSFTAAPGSCGYQVTGSATFPLNIGFFSTSIALKSHACFP
jgi:Flp pilus assembly protein TadG